MNETDEKTVNSNECTGRNSQLWFSMQDDNTIRTKSTKHCLSAEAEQEVWAGPLSDGSQAVVLLNRDNQHSHKITVQWIDIGFPSNHTALVRDLWKHKDIGTFKGSYTSSKIKSHSVQMLKISLINAL